MVNLDNKNHKLAIVGININCGSLDDLDEFERNVYEGEKYDISLDDNLNINEILNRILHDVEVESKAKIAIIINNSENNIASISQTELSNLSFTHTATSKTVFSAIQMAQKLLTAGEVDVVLICDAPEGAIVLKLETDALKKHQRIYAVIDGLTVSQNSSPTAQTITQTCHQAFNIAGFKPKEIGYLEISSSGILEASQLEIKGLVDAYQTPTELSCAVGSVKANTANSQASEIISLIKTVLCLYYRYIPGVPKWSKPENTELWESSSFYVQTESKPWFLAAETSKRVAAINSFRNGHNGHLILSEGPTQERDGRYLTQIPYYLFPIAADEPAVLLQKIQDLENTISLSDSLTVTAAQTFTEYQKYQNAAYAVAILGCDRKELQRETQRAIKGVKKAFETGKDWKTPLGSYFTAKPLGKKGKVAFVYPPTYSSYIGIARNLFRLFPKIWDSPVIQSVYSRAASIEKLLYPRSVKALTRRQLEALEKELIDNPISMLELEVGFAGLITTVLKDYFGLQPQSCSGYSVGEISMMVSQGIWSSFNQTSSGLNSSELFTNRLSGAKNAVREYWGLENTEIHKELWGNYVLMAEVFQVREQLKNEPRVYLTQINTSKEVVIAGEPQACQRVIAAIGCNAIPAPFNYLIHCEAMASEYDEFVRLHTLPINKKPEIDFYSSAEYKIVQQDRDMVAHAIAKNVCQQLDFPKLVNQLYADGARIFVEAGAGNSCSRWIKENLKDKEHTTIFLNRKGIAEHTSLLRGLGQLLSHRVSFDLSPLYKSNLPVENSSLDLQSFTERNVWEELEPALPKFQPKPVNSYDSKKQTSSDNIQPMVTLSPYYWNKFSMEELRINATYQTRILHSLGVAKNNKPDTIDTNQDFASIVSSNQQLNSILPNNKNLSNFLHNNTDKINQANLQAGKSQNFFLKTRQKSFNQMVEMVSLQLSLLSQEFQ